MTDTSIAMAYFWAGVLVGAVIASIVVVLAVRL